MTVRPVPSRRELEAIGEEIAEVSVRLAAATQHLLALIRRFDEGGGWAAQGALSCAHWLSWRVGMSLGAAREHVRVAKALGTLPALDALFRAGKISYSKVRALTRVARPHTEQELLDVARTSTASQLERLVRSYGRALEASETTPAKSRDDEDRRSLRLYPDGNGMVRLVAVLRTEEADLVRRALDAARATLRLDPAEAVADVPAGTRRPEDAQAAGQAAGQAEGQAEGQATSAAAEGPRDVRAEAPTAARPEGSASAPSLEQTVARGVDVPAETSTAAEVVSAETSPTAQVPAGHSAGGGERTRDPGPVSAEGATAAPAPGDTSSDADDDDEPWPREHEDDDVERLGAARDGDRDDDDLDEAELRSAKLDPVRPSAEDRARWGSLADALVLLAESFLARGPSQRNAGARTMVMLRADDGVLTGARPDGVAELEDGTPISPETARRLACDASVCRVVDGPNGQPLDVGRRTRTIPPSLRRALERRDRGCRFPGCTHTLFVDAHHIEHWAHGGATNLANTILLCRRHHTLLHEGGFRVERSANGDLTFRAPRGAELRAVPDLPSLDRDPLAALEEAHAVAKEELRQADLRPVAYAPMDLDYAVGTLLDAAKSSEGRTR